MDCIINLYKVLHLLVYSRATAYITKRIKKFDACMYQVTGGECAVVCPGESSLKYITEINESDFVISVNLASALDARSDINLIERVDASDYGRAQLELITVRGGTIVLKNIWDKPSKTNAFNLDSDKTYWLRDVPLRLSGLLPKKYIIRYMRHKKFAYSNWKSSLFVAVNMALAMGYDKVTIYGAMGGNQYLWEPGGGSEGVLNLKYIYSVKSKPIHDSRQGVSADELFRLVYRSEILSGKIRVVL